MEYFSTTRRGGAVDLWWYNGTDTEFTITTPAQLAGVAALVNGQTSAETTRWRIKGDASLLVCEESKDASLVGSGGGNVKGIIYRATAAYDFAGKTVKLAADMDMGGVGGIIGLFNECTITNSYNYGTMSRNKDSVDCAMGGAIGFDRKSGTGKLEEVAAKAENSGSIRFLLRYQRRPVWQRRRKAAGVRRHLCDPHRLRPYRQDRAGAGGTRHLHRDRPYRYRLVTVSFRHRQTAL